MNFLMRLFKILVIEPEYGKRDFVEWMTAIAAARQVQAPDSAMLTLYYERLQCFTREEMIEAVDALMDEPYRNFPTVGSFIEIIAEGSGKTAREFGSRRRRAWMEGGTAEQRHLTAQKIADEEKRATMLQIMQASKQSEERHDTMKMEGPNPGIFFLECERGRLRHEINVTESMIEDKGRLRAREDRRLELSRQEKALKEEPNGETTKSR